MNPLAEAIAAGINAACAVSEERIREIVREELSLARTRPTDAGWLTPPRAAMVEGISTKRVYAAVRSGLVETRPRNLEPAGAKQIKLEVHMDSLRKYLCERGAARKPTDAATWARARAERKNRWQPEGSKPK